MLHRLVQRVLLTTTIVRMGGVHFHNHKVQLFAMTQNHNYFYIDLLSHHKLLLSTYV